MDEIAVLFDRLQALEPRLRLKGPAPDSEIELLEARFGRPMPPSYRAFLTRFGAFSIINSVFSGIITGRYADCKGNVWVDTTVAREWCQLPDHYLVISPDEDGFKCLDFSRTTTEGEHPVIYHMPFRRTPFHEMAPDYRTWLTEALEALIEAWTDAPDLPNGPLP